MARHLILKLEAPLMAFGGETIDNFGVVRPFPAKSMVVGLLANALGLARHQSDHLQRLQDRLVMGCRIDRAGVRVRDFQTAQLAANDRAWTTRGRFEGRAGGAGTYRGPHLRYRDYHADAVATVALRLEPAGEPPDLDEIATKLDAPTRPLFIGRKPCLPSGPLFAGFIEAGDIHGALAAAPPQTGPEPSPRAQWPAGEGPIEPGDQVRHTRICDERNWISGLHGGDRPVHWGMLAIRQGSDGQ